MSILIATGYFYYCSGSLANPDNNRVSFGFNQRVRKWFSARRLTWLYAQDLTKTWESVKYSTVKQNAQQSEIMNYKTTSLVQRGKISK